MATNSKNNSHQRFMVFMAFLALFSFLCSGSAKLASDFLNKPLWLESISEVSVGISLTTWTLGVMIPSFVYSTKEKSQTIKLKGCYALLLALLFAPIGILLFTRGIIQLVSGHLVAPLIIDLQIP